MAPTYWSTPVACLPKNLTAGVLLNCNSCSCSAQMWTLVATVGGLLQHNQSKVHLCAQHQLTWLYSHLCRLFCLGKYENFNQRWISSLVLPHIPGKHPTLGSVQFDQIPENLVSNSLSMITWEVGSRLYPVVSMGGWCKKRCSSSKVVTNNEFFFNGASLWGDL